MGTQELLALPESPPRTHTFGICRFGPRCRNSVCILHQEPIARCRGGAAYRQSVIGRDHLLRAHHPRVGPIVIVPRLSIQFAESGLGTYE
jgi:hypothetical protein